MNINSRYEAKEIEEKWYQFWLDNNLFDSEIDTDKEPYTILIPPPNVTGVLHMGHALNNTFQDYLIRYWKMNGKNTLWIPGTDHAGIATQNVVERQLKKENLRKEDIGREEFIKKIWEWKKEKGSAIIDQLKKLGCACDWRREKFTMDNKMSKLVTDCFIHLYKKDLIYEGEYIVNHCPRCQTALADDEVEHEENNGKLYYLKYYFDHDPSKYVTIATTRPETILGDTGVAYNSKDKRYNSLRVNLRVPLTDRIVPTVQDHYVKMDFGTGLVKITPAHDKNDFLVGQRCCLMIRKVIDTTGKMYNTGTKYDGMDRFECRKQIVIDLEENGFIEKVEDHINKIGTCYRCQTIIEPYLSNQWFVKMKPLAEDALKAVNEGSIKLVPEYHKSVYNNWLENVTDWCISRQIWWGHRIPIYRCLSCRKIHCEDKMPSMCSCCHNDKLEQDNDVLDTWFSSWLWSFSVFNSKEELEYYTPTSTLLTGSDILFFWVARMIMASIEFTGDIPFKEVYLHGVVRDEVNDKMSKSKGNVINPLDIIDEFSADILRFTLCMTTPRGADVKISEKSFEIGKTFCTKFWNSVRYCLMNIEDKDTNTINFESYKEDMDVVSRWIISKLNETINSVNQSVKDYDFSQATRTIYTFVWDYFCNTYLEFIKSRISSQVTQNVLLTVLEALCRLLHPVIPFLTEELWQKLKTLIPELKTHVSIMNAKWPTQFSFDFTEKEEGYFYTMKDMIKKIRNIKAEYSVPLKDDALHLKIVNIGDYKLKEYLEKNWVDIQHMTRLQKIEYFLGMKSDKECLIFELDSGIDIYVVLDSSLKLESKINFLQRKMEGYNDKVNKIKDKITKCNSDNKKIKLQLKENDFLPVIEKIQLEIELLSIYSNKKD